MINIGCETELWRHERVFLGESHDGPEEAALTRKVNGWIRTK
jgi:hypothetical protein